MTIEFEEIVATANDLLNEVKEMARDLEALKADGSLDESDEWQAGLKIGMAADRAAGAWNFVYTFANRKAHELWANDEEETAEYQTWNTIAEDADEKLGKAHEYYVKYHKN